MVAPMVLVTLVTIALMGFGLFWAANRSDAISIERQVRVASRAVDASITALALAQEPLAVWDEAIEKSQSPSDPEWFLGGYVSFFQGVWPGGKIFMLDGNDRALYAAEGDRIVPNEHFETLRPEIAGMLDELRARVVAPGHPNDRLMGVGTPPKRAGTLGRADYVLYVAHRKRIDGRPAAVSIMRMIPVHSRVSLWRGREPLLVNVRFLDQIFLDELAERSLIGQPRFAEGPDRRAGEVSIPLMSEDGGEVAHLLWSPELPGTRILNKLLPLAAGSALLSAGATFLLVRSLRRATRHLQESERQAQHLSLHDTLTGLPNRALFTDRLDQAVARAERGEVVALLLLDLDRFKQVNDGMGHAAGDAVLREFARRLSGLVRAEDTLARFGGDEFGIIMHRPASLAGVEALCHRLLDATRRPFGLPEGTALLGVSIGVAMLPEAGVERAEVMRAADRALYLAKEGGRDRFHLFRADPERGAPRAAFTGALRAA